MTEKSLDIKKLSFEQALQKLEEIVNGFEGHQIDLDVAIKNYSLGEELKAHCEKKLNDARLKVEKITTSQNGDISLTQFDAD